MQQVATLHYRSPQQVTPVAVNPIYLGAARVLEGPDPNNPPLSSSSILDSASPATALDRKLNPANVINPTNSLSRSISFSHHQPTNPVPDKAIYTQEPYSSMCENNLDTSSLYQQLSYPYILILNSHPQLLCLHEESPNQLCQGHIIHILESLKPQPPRTFG